MRQFRCDPPEIWKKEVASLAKRVIFDDDAIFKNSSIHSDDFNSHAFAVIQELKQQSDLGDLGGFLHTVLRKIHSYNCDRSTVEWIESNWVDGKNSIHQTLSAYKLLKDLAEKTIETENSLIGGSQMSLGRVVVFVPPVEEHNFGANILAHQLRKSRYEVEFCVQKPVESVMEIVSTGHVDVVGISVGCDESFFDLANQISGLRLNSCNPDLAVLISGAAIDDNKEAYSFLNAEGVFNRNECELDLIDQFIGEHTARRHRYNAQRQKPSEFFSSIPAQNLASVVTQAVDFSIVLSSDLSVTEVIAAPEFKTINFTHWIGLPLAATVAPDSKPKVEKLIADNAASPFNEGRWRHLNFIISENKTIPLLSKYFEFKHGNTSSRVIVARDLSLIEDLTQRFQKEIDSIHSEFSR